MDERTSLETLRDTHAKPRANASSRPRSAASRAKYEQYERDRYKQTCSACRANGDPDCWLCSGTGYVLGNGSANYGIGAGSCGAGNRRTTTPRTADDLDADWSARPSQFQEGVAGTVGPRPISYDEWQQAGLHPVSGATGSPVGRPRLDEAALTPAARRKRKSREARPSKEPRRLVEATTADRARWALEIEERNVARESWAKHVEDVTNTPYRGRVLPLFASPELVPVGPFANLSRDKAFGAVYAGYQAEIPTATHLFRLGQPARYADFTVDFGRLLERSFSWSRSPMHAAVEQIKPTGRRDAGARLEHEWFRQALEWRGQRCLCGHVDVIDHLRELAGTTPAYVSMAVLAQAQSAFTLIGMRSRLVAS